MIMNNSNINIFITILEWNDMEMLKKKFDC